MIPRRISKSRPAQWPDPGSCIVAFRASSRRVAQSGTIRNKFTETQASLQRRQINVRGWRFLFSTAAAHRARHARLHGASQVPRGNRRPAHPDGLLFGSNRCISSPGPQCALRPTVANPTPARHWQRSSSSPLSHSAGRRRQPATRQRETVFANQCASCHTIEVGKNGFGPSLAGVFDRKAGSLAGYNYSPAMAQSGLTWDEKTLDRLPHLLDQGSAGDVDAGVPAERDRPSQRDRLSRDARTHHRGGGQRDSDARGVEVPLPRARRRTSCCTRRQQAELALREQGLHRAALCRSRPDHAQERRTIARRLHLSLQHRRLHADQPAGLQGRDVSDHRPRPPWPSMRRPAASAGPTTGSSRERCSRRPTAAWRSRTDALVRGTADGYLIAVDMAKGTLLWSQKIADAKTSQYLSMPPLIYEDLVIYGPAGADWGAKNWIGAFRLATGEPVWRFNLIPDAGEPGAETWTNPESREHGGGSLWTPLSLDVKAGRALRPGGQPLAGLLPRRASRNQSVHQLGGRPGYPHRQAPLVPAIRSRRCQRPGLEPGEPALQRDGERQAAQPAHRFGQGWVAAHARPRHPRGALRAADHHAHRF